MNLKAPFPYFGGKSRVAHIVWQALGNPKHYLEPFFGSGAVLLARPNYDPTTHIETVNDKDCMLANAWRAMKYAPDEVAEHCDYPVHHTELACRRRILVKSEESLRDRLIEDEGYYDAKLAGYWIWCMSLWIGAGMMKVSDGIGGIPFLAHRGRGVKKLSMREGIGKRPHLSSTGHGIKKISMRGNENLKDWFNALAERFRHVRVTCGDWTIICNGNWQDGIGDVGFFLDPPYGVKTRHTKLYTHDSTDIAKDVLQWCKERGNKQTYRIVLAGYEEYEELLSFGWRKMQWKANGGYGNQGSGQGRENKHRETLYFSPYCIKKDKTQTELL